MIPSIGQCPQNWQDLLTQVLEGILRVVRRNDPVVPNSQILSQLLHGGAKHFGAVQVEPDALFVGS